MTLQDFNTALDRIPNVGHVYGYFPDNQEVPYIAYNATQANPIFSDGKVIYSEESITLILVTRRRDLSAEDYIDRLLTCCRIQFNKAYQVDGEQKTHTVTYTFTLD